MLEGLFAFLDGLPEFVRVWLLRFLALMITLVLLTMIRRFTNRAFLRPLRIAAKLTRSTVDDRLLKALLLPIRSGAVVLLFLLLANLLIPSDREYWNVIWTISKLVALVVALIFVYRLIDILLFTSRDWFRITGIVIEERLLPFIRVSLKILLLTVGFVIMVQELGYDVNALLAALGVGGFGLSLAAKDTVANVFGFVSIVGDRPCDVGDYIVTPHGEGIVEAVGIRSTKLRQLDQALVSIPNNLLNNCFILNWSRLQKRRIDMRIAVRYKTDPSTIGQFIERLRALLMEQPTVQEDSIVVYLINFGPSSLEVMVRCYIKIADWGEFTAEKERLMFQIMRLAEELDITFAFNTMSLHIEDLSKVPSQMLNMAPPPASAAASPTGAPPAATGTNDDVKQ